MLIKLRMESCRLVTFNLRLQEADCFTIDELPKCDTSEKEIWPAGENLCVEGDHKLREPASIDVDILDLSFATSPRNSY